MDDVDDLIDRCREKLGDPDGVYRPAPLARNLLRGSGLLVGGLLVGGLTLWFVPKVAGGLAKFLLALPVLGGVLVWHALAGRGRAVLTYPDGLLPVGRGEVAWLPWDGVTALHLRAKNGTVERTPGGVRVAVVAPEYLLNTAVLTLHAGADRPPVVVRPSLVGYAELVERAQVETFARRWPAARDQFDAGETVGFGPFDLHRDGLGRGSKVLPWDRVKAVELKGGKVQVKRRGRWLAWAAESLEKVPDPHLFFALVDHALGAAGDPGDQPG